MTSVLWLTVPVWWTLILSGTLAQDNCVYWYTEQPPASPGCSLDEGQIQLKCKVTGPHNPHDPRLGIRWFRNSVQLQNDSTFTLTSLSEGNNITSTLTVQNWELNHGSYYCQLSISDDTSQTIPSVSLVLGDQLNSPGLPECPSNTFFQTEPSCASVPMTRLPSPSVTATPMLLITSTTQTLVTSRLSLYTSPLPTPSPTVTTGDVTPPSTSPATSRTPTPPTSATVSSTSTGPSGTTTPLQVWLYVVVAVAAVFAMIIIILVILCVGLCLRKSKTGDLETPKPQEHPELHFTANGTSVVSNGLDQKHPDIQGSFTATTQLTNHSQSITVPETSNYNTLGERDYEVVSVVQNHEYHHLQRPTLQRSRAATYGPFSSSNTSAKDMRTMTSAMSTSTQDTSKEMMRRDPATLASPPGSDRHHPYRNIDERRQNEPVYDPIVVRKPAVKNSQFSERGDTAHLLPNHHTRSRASHKTSDTLESDVHESLYNPTVGLPGNAPNFHHALANIPETGTMFPEPLCPSAFPVREYDCIPTTTSHYETPVSSKEGQSNCTATSLMSTMSSEYTKMSSDNLNGIMATGFVSSTMSSDYPKSSTDFTGSDAADFTVESTPDCTGASTIDFTVGSTAGRSMTSDSNSSLNGMVNHGEMTSAKTFRSLPEFPNVKSFANAHNKSYTANPMPGTTSDIVDHSTCTETSDFSGPILFPHMTERNHQYKKLDPSTMEPAQQYSKLTVGQRTDIV